MNKADTKFLNEVKPRVATITETWESWLYKTLVFCTFQLGKCSPCNLLDSNRKIVQMIARDEKVIHNFLKDRQNYCQNYHGRRSSLTTRHKSLLILGACDSLKSASKHQEEFNLNIGVRRTHQLLSLSRIENKCKNDYVYLATF